MVCGYEAAQYAASLLSLRKSDMSIEAASAEVLLGPMPKMVSRQR